MAITKTDFLELSRCPRYSFLENLKTSALKQDMSYEEYQEKEKKDELKDNSKENDEGISLYDTSISEYVKETEDGIKINTNALINSDKMLDNLTITNIQLIYNSGITSLTANVTNNSNVETPITTITAILKDEKEQEIGNDDLRELERVVMLKVVDQKWMDHIDAMDELKDGIGLRAYGQQDPVVKYRIEGMDMFEEMVLDIKHDVVKILMNLRKQEDVKREEAAKITGAALQAINSLDNGEQIKTEVNKTVVNEGPKVGRNDPCPCGSGKKYKKCCGANA